MNKFNYTSAVQLFDLKIHQQLNFKKSVADESSDETAVQLKCC